MYTSPMAAAGEVCAAVHLAGRKAFRVRALEVEDHAVLVGSVAVAFLVDCERALELVHAPPVNGLEVGDGLCRGALRNHWDAPWFRGNLLKETKARLNDFGFRLYL